MDLLFRCYLCYLIVLPKRKKKPPSTITILCITVAILLFVTQSIVYVKPGYQVIVQDYETCQRRALDQGWHVIKSPEQFITVDWIWQEENRVGQHASVHISTQVMHVHPPSVSVRSNCGIEVNVSSRITFRIVEPLKTVEYTQPLERMCFELASITKNVISNYNYTDSLVMKEDIQEKIVSEFSHEGQRLGIVCDKIIIKYWR